MQHCGVFNCAADRTEATISAAGSRNPGVHRGAPAAHQASCQRRIRCRYTACENRTEGGAQTLGMCRLHTVGKHTSWIIGQTFSSAAVLGPTTCIHLLGSASYAADKTDQGEKVCRQYLSGS